MTSSADRLPPRPLIKTLCANRTSVVVNCYWSRHCEPGSPCEPPWPRASRGAVPHHTIRIAPISLEIGSNKVIQTTGYNNRFQDHHSV